MSALLEDVCPECGAANPIVMQGPGGESDWFELSCRECPATLLVPEEPKSRKRIDAVREVLTSGAKRIDGFIVDAQTASMLVAVYEALSPRNKQRFGKPPLDKLVDLGWRCVR